MREFEELWGPDITSLTYCSTGRRSSISCLLAAHSTKSSARRICLPNSKICEATRFPIFFIEGKEGGTVQSAGAMIGAAKKKNSDNIKKKGEMRQNEQCNAAYGGPFESDCQGPIELGRR